MEIQQYIYDESLEQDVKPSDIEITDFIYSIDDLPDKYRNKFYGCVPDCNNTNELWSLYDITMDYLGEMDGVDINHYYVYGIGEVTINR